MRLDAINEDGHQSLRQALANVYASLNPDDHVRLVYLLDARASGVDLYFGVAADSEHSADLHEAIKTLRGALEGQLPGVNFGTEELQPAGRAALLGRIANQPHRGVLLGVPTAQDAQQQAQQQDAPNFQDLNRLVGSLQTGGSSGQWQLTIVSQPLPRAHIQAQLDAAYALASELASQVKTNVQYGTNASDTRGTNEGGNDSRSTGTNSSDTTGTNDNFTRGTSEGHSEGTSEGQTKGQSKGISSGTNESTSMGTNTSTSWGSNESTNTGRSASHSTNTGTSSTHGTSTNKSTSDGKSGSSWSSSTSNSGGENWSKTTNSGSSESISTNDGKSWGTNKGGSSGTNESLTRGTNTGRNESENWGSNWGSNKGRNWGTNESTTRGTSASHTRGTSDTTTTGRNWGTNESKTSGHSLNLSNEIANKHAQHLLEYLDKQLIARLQKGLARGLFHTAIYLSASTPTLYARLKNAARSTFQGSAGTLAPLQAHDLPALPADAASAQAALLALPSSATRVSDAALLAGSLAVDEAGHLGSLLTADELAIAASLPEHEMPGIRRRRVLEFVVDLPEIPADKNALALGQIMDRGRLMGHTRMQLVREDLNKHTFITGVTGAGKTTTCLTLLLGSNLPFLVIEPAKTEYRELQQYAAQVCTGRVDYYRPNGDTHQSLRINPFALTRSGQRIKSHAGFLKNVFAAVFPLEASMPQMLEAAILKAYEARGWDVDTSEFLGQGNPFEPQTRAWPTMSEMIAQLDPLIKSYGLGKELEEKYRGSLVSRLRGLTDGTLGEILDVPQSIDFGQLLDRCVVIELEELQSGEEKALLMALILGSINEAIRAKHAANKNFRHLTLIEEAHRLLAKPEPGDKGAALAVQAFADMLAEVRKFGEGLIIADQIPAKLIADVIKNTHTKIVHRLFAEDDRRAMGEAMMMSDEQRGFLPNLGLGEAIVFCGGWHGPSHAQIAQIACTTAAHTTANPFDGDAAAHQLWAQSARYYPLLRQVAGFAALQTPAGFAQFVHETRGAHRQLLRIAAWHYKPQPSQGEAVSKTALTYAIAKLQHWHAHWSSQASAPTLVAAWVALLCDAVLRPRPDIAHGAEPQPLENSSALREATAELLTLIPQCTTPQQWQQAISLTNALADHLVHLGRDFKGL